MTYLRRKFAVNNVAGDNEFSSVEAWLSDMGKGLSMVVRGQHMPEVERHIRTLKERCQAAFNTLPFNALPSRMAMVLVYAMTFRLHVFPNARGLTQDISSPELVSGDKLAAIKHCALPFGTYVRTHQEHDNSMATCTIGAIALRRTGSTQGGHYFFSIKNGKRINLNQYTEVTMPAEVIERVNQMAG